MEEHLEDLLWLAICKKFLRMLSYERFLWHLRILNRDLQKPNLNRSTATRKAQKVSHILEKKRKTFLSGKNYVLTDQTLVVRYILEMYISLIVLLRVLRTIRLLFPEYYYPHKS